MRCSIPNSRHSECGASTLQERLWAEQWRYVRARSALYRAKLDRRLPAELALGAFSDKEDPRASQERWYPFGDYIACGEDQLVRLHRTSGPTGAGMAAQPWRAA